jgi:Trypsin-co-occurring domain 1
MLPVRPTGRTKAMAELVRFQVEGGGELIVQAAAADVRARLVEDDDDALVPASRVRDWAGGSVTQATESLQHALRKIEPGLRAVTGELRKLAPDEVTVEFGLILAAETGAVLAKTGAEVHFTVTLGWKAEPSGRAVPDRAIP